MGGKFLANFHTLCSLFFSPSLYLPRMIIYLRIFTLHEENLGGRPLPLPGGAKGVSIRKETNVVGISYMVGALAQLLLILRARQPHASHHEPWAVYFNYSCFDQMSWSRPQVSYHGPRVRTLGSWCFEYPFILRWENEAGHRWHRVEDVYHEILLVR